MSLELKQNTLTLRKGTMIMNTKTLPFYLSLQFFASEQTTGDTSADAGLSDIDTDTESTSENGDTSAENVDGNRYEEEFEKLIKGGKYENAFQKRVQGIIDKRFKNLKSLEETQAKQKCVFDFLSEKYGIDSSDPSLLLEKMQSENSEDVKETTGNNAERPDLQKRNDLVSEKAMRLSRQWTEDGRQLKKIFPNFDFKTELKNPVFSSLLKSGMPLRKAYTAAHSDEILKNAVSGTAKKVAEQTLKSIRAQGSRVAENGLHNGAGIIRKTDVSSLSGKEIRSILKQVENGSKIRF